MTSLDVVLQAIPLACQEKWAQRDVTRYSKSATAGFCALASIFIQKKFGGTIARGLMSNGVTHYWNILPTGAWVDSTRSQFDNDIYPTYVIEDCPRTIYWFKDTETKYYAFESELWRQIEALEGKMKIAW